MLTAIIIYHLSIATRLEVRYSSIPTLRVMEVEVLLIVAEKTHTRNSSAHPFSSVWL
jgi:hypothetical protein